MALVIATNIPALEARGHLERSQHMLGESIGKLSSGLRINRASDDAVGLGISENLKADIRSLSQARRNANDAVSMSQLAEGAMNNIQGIVTRMRELAVQSANGTLGTDERNYIETEFFQLKQEIDRISAVTDYNGQHLIDGTAANGLSMQVGIHSAPDNQLLMSIGTIVASALGSTGGGLTLGSAAVSTVTQSLQALAALDRAIQQLSEARAKVGAFQNRVRAAIDNLSVAHEHLTGANSRIRDVDVAEESGTFVKNQILTQAGVAILGQANQLPASALKLLGA